MIRRFAMLMLGMAVVYAVTLAQQTTPEKSDKQKERKIQEQKEENPLRREEQLFGERAYPNGTIPQGAYIRAMQQARSMEGRKGSAALMAAQPKWRLIGPDNIGGRTRSVVVHPTKDLVFAAAAGGGIWRSATSDGAGWEPLFDNENSICMGALAIDTKNPDVIYAGTGEMNGQPMNPATGAGMYKSTDGGKTWNNIGLTTVLSFSKVYVHPKNSNLVVASAARSGQGFYKSTDAGKTWQRMNRYTISDMTINPENESEFFIGVWSQGVFKSTDGGETWTKTTTNMFPSSIGRVSVQCAPSKPSTLYALFEGPNEDVENTPINRAMIYKSTNSGANWAEVLVGNLDFFQPNGGGDGQGWYDNFIMVHPTNPNIVIGGGIELYRTTNGGSSWVNISHSYSGGVVHPDQHCGFFDPKNPNIIYIGNDGGVYRSPNIGDDWTAMNTNYAVTQFYAMDIDQGAENRTYGGSQDNGTLGSVQQQISWDGVMGGDGFYVVVDPTNPNIIYAEVYNGGMRKVNLSTGSVIPNVNGIPTNDAGAWSSPMVLDRNGGRLWHGRHALYTQVLGQSKWDVASPRWDTTISAIGTTPASEDILWAGLANGNLYRSTTGGETWANVSFNGLPRRFVRDVVPSVEDKKTAWVCYSGYGTGHIYRTNDYGATWTDISTGLPDVPVNAIALRSDNEKVIFAGTDVGVFASFNGGESWIPYGTGLPRAPVLDMSLHENKNVLRIATHGRSMWEIDIPSEAIDEPIITAPTGGEIVMANSSMTLSWHGFKDPVNVDITYTDGQYWSPLAYGVVGGAMRWVVENRPTQYARIRVTEVNNPNVSLVSRSFTILEYQKGSVQKTTSVAHVAYGIAYDGNNGLWTTSFYTPKLYKLNATTMQIEKEFSMPKDQDQNCTDLTIDRAKGEIYVHRLTRTDNNPPAKIVVIDTNGNLIRVMNSPSNSYALGLELVDGKLIVSERDGSQQIYICNPADAKLEKFVDNPFKEYYGPRCMAYDAATSLIYEVGTQFGQGGGGLQGAYAVRINKNTLNKEVDRMELLNGAGGQINARGIELDPRDNNLWITDLEGNIYKIAGFNTPSNPLSDVTPSEPLQSSGIIISPNPARDQTVIGFMIGKVSANVQLEVFSLVGERVATLIDGTVSTDDVRAAILDCSSLPNGVYTVSLTVDGIRRPAEKFIISR